MSFSTQHDAAGSTGVSDAEKALRLIAALPAPEGIADRVKHRLHTAPSRAGVISWPTSATGARWKQLSAMRGAAAAAIVFAVAGGVWEVYAHIRIAPEPAAVATPQRMDGSSGLSAAGAVRKPQTLEGPVVAVDADVKKSDGVKKAVPPNVHGTTPAAVKNQSVRAAQR